MAPGAREAIDKEQPLGPDALCVEQPLAAAVATMRAAQRLTEMWWPPYDDEDYVPTAALLAGRLTSAPAPGIEADADWEPLEDTARQALLDRFFSAVGLPDDEITRELADLCVTYADGWVVGGALMWSPAIVERYLLDWLPRKTFLDAERRRLVPSVTFAFVGWALIERGVSGEAAAAAAQVALDLEADFAQLYDETERSPATDVARYLQDNDVEVRDADAVERAISAYNAEQNARRLLE